MAACLDLLITLSPVAAQAIVVLLGSAGQKNSSGFNLTKGEKVIYKQIGSLVLFITWYTTCGQQMRKRGAGAKLMLALSDHQTSRELVLRRIKALIYGIWPHKKEVCSKDDICS